MDPLALILSLLTAAALGGLIGLEREIHIQNKENILETAGLRTFSMMGILGFMSVYFFREFENFWLIPLFFLGALSFSLISHGFLVFKREEIGITSELASIGSFGVGMLVAMDEMFLAISISILFTGLLALKFHLHGIAQKLNQKELIAILKFLIVSFVVLKVMPTEWVDPWGIFNWRPKVIWLMVVFVAGIRFIGYFLAKFVGTTKSILLSGIVGGLASSTAVTTSLSQQSKGQKEYIPFFTAILIASGIMFFRVILEVSFVSRELLSVLSWPLLVMGAIAFGVAGILFLRKKELKNLNSQLEIEQPFDLKSALLFGLFFITIIFISEKIQSSGIFGDLGLYATGAIAGLTDVDAITLAMANLVKTKGIDLHLASTVIFIAVIVNTLVKVGIIFLFGSRKLALHFLWALLLLLGVGGGIFWMAT